MAIATTYVHQFAQAPGGHDIPCLPQRWVISVIEGHPNSDVRSAARFRNCIQLCCTTGTRLLDQDVLASRYGDQGDLGERVMRRRDEDDVDISSFDGALPVHLHLYASHGTGECKGPLRDDV